MKEMCFPDYKNSILNLMSSIQEALGVKNKIYKPLKMLKPEELERKNIVLMVVDGLGYNYLSKHGQNTILKEKLRGKISSVFPSATTAAIPIFSTGTSCLKHGMVSWFSYIKEFGEIILPLPYVTRIMNLSLKKNVPMAKIFDIEPIAKKAKMLCYLVINKKLSDSEFTKLISRGSKIIPYKKERDFFKKIEKTIKSGNKRKFIYAYWPEHDHLCHVSGTRAKKTLSAFKKFNIELKKFVKSIEETGTIVIVTADHGAIDVPKSKKIEISDHPVLEESLRIPLCEDFRYAFCYISLGKEKKFLKYLKTKLKKYCLVYKSSELVRKGIFGLEKPSKRFLERIGDYVILMRKDYGIYQQVEGEKGKHNIGEHGGLSEEEMLVPLIIIK